MPKFSTQSFLKFKKIKEGIIILKNKGLRAILMVSSLNFALKSLEEQKAILYQFQSFLNSLDFSCQILVQSRKLNIIGYLEKLKKIEKEEENKLLKTQISEYRNFIGQIIEGGTIMQKTFYLIIPFSPGEGGKNLKFKKRKKYSKSPSELSEEEFQRAKIQLFQRVEFVSLGLKASGLQSVPLNTPELIELFWSLHHPAEAERGYHPEIPPELAER